MQEFFAKRSEWLIRVTELRPSDILTIHPLDGLTGKMVVEAMAAQGLLRHRPGYVIREHGTKIFIQREASR